MLDNLLYLCGQFRVKILIFMNFSADERAAGVRR